MNRIKKSMEGIHASDELKKNTLKYVEEQREKQFRRKRYHAPRYAFSVICLFLFLTAGAYIGYSKPVSYISMDVNPSIEMGVNCFGRVVSVEGYNEDGKDVLDYISVKNLSYMQAIDRILKNEEYHEFLTENSQLVFTVISDDSDAIVEEIRANRVWQTYGALVYTSDEHCREEAHQYGMSFGKYRAYQELAEYEENITVEDCHGMTMEEIQNRISSCRNHVETENGEIEGESGHNQGKHRGHHGHSIR